MTFEISGDHNTATVHTQQSRGDAEEDAIEQIQEMVNHKAFVGDDDIAIMCDFHWGAGAVIGFTMPVKDRVVPNTIGVDIGCFTGDTKIPLLDGNDYRIDELSRRDDEFAVYSVTEDGKIDVAWATGHKTREDAPLVRVELDNGEKVRCTPDHEFMLRGGEFVEARDLKEGDSLMPHYQGETEDGYVLNYHNIQGPIGERSVREHWLVARSECMNIPKDIDNVLIHHKNFNKKDNRPENLEFMSPSDHSRLHCEIGGGDHWQSEEFEERRIQALKSRETTPEEIEAATENIIQYIENNREEWLEKISDNGERGAEYLEEFNTSERECSVCGSIFDNPAEEYWHQVNEHPDKTEYTIRDNHTVSSVDDCDETEDVYCLNVPKYGNFALSAGVFVHNCGMYATKLNVPDFEKEKNLLYDIDQEIRDRIPMGFDVHDRGSFHMVNDFPWKSCKAKLESFNDSQGAFDLPDPEDVYTETYFEELCNTIGYDQTRAINSVGTLGGGNHFIELGEDENDDVWAIIHSGSRGIGAEIAQYWQDKATSKTTARQTIDDVPESVREYMDEDWNPKADKIRSEFDGSDIQDKFDEVSRAINEYGPSSSNRNTDLDYLQGDEANGYIIDMIFAQTYASVSRHEMAKQVAQALAHTLGVTEAVDTVESVHNYIDFDDGIIRKGACRAHEGERLVVPFNMAYGTILARGRGKDSWNNSSAHGAGRAMSRTAAKERFDTDDFSEQIGDVYMSKRPMDEIPGAYKPAEQIEEALGDSVEIIDRIEPFMSLKAE